MTILLFILLLIVTFAVLLYFLRPTATETAVQQHLENIEDSRAVEGDGTTILRREALSATPWLDELIRDIAGIGGPGAAHPAGWANLAGEFCPSFFVGCDRRSLPGLASLAIPSVVLSVILG